MMILTLSNALRDPSGWLMSLPKPVFIDEVQRVPEIFLAMKLDIDKNRAPRTIFTHRFIQSAVCRRIWPILWQGEWVY